MFGKIHLYFKFRFVSLEAKKKKITTISRANYSKVNPCAYACEIINSAILVLSYRYVL